MAWFFSVFPRVKSLGSTLGHFCFCLWLVGGSVLIYSVTHHYLYAPEIFRLKIYFVTVLLEEWQSLNFYYCSPRYCSPKALYGIATVSHVVLKSWRESGMKEKVKMRIFEGTQLQWKIIKNRHRNVCRGRNMPFGRSQWISAVPLKTLLNAVFPRTLTWHIGIVVQASALSFFQLLAHSLPAPLIVILKCRLERHALRLWKSVSLCHPHHIIYFYILLYLHNRNFLQSPCNLKTQSLKEKC